MRVLIRMLSVVLLLLSSISAKELELDSEMPLADVKMMDVSGEKLSLKDVSGPKGTVVIFSCNTCPWVDAWEDRYVQLASTFVPKGVGFIAVNSNETYRKKGDGYTDMQARAKEKKYNFYYVLDEESQLARAFGATRTPHVFIFNAEGKLIYHGAIDDNAKNPSKVEDAYVANALDASLAGKDVAVASTKSLGCTIKFKD
jgi:thioredoxin-related protein